MMTDHLQSADLDILNLLTGPAPPSRSSLTTRHHAAASSASVKKPLPRRPNEMDPILLSAVIEGSAPKNRQHFGHEFQRLPLPVSSFKDTAGSSSGVSRRRRSLIPGQYKDCDESRPATPNGQQRSEFRPSMSVMRSQQAPRRERARLLAAIKEEEEQRRKAKMQLRQDLANENRQNSDNAINVDQPNGPSPVQIRSPPDHSSSLPAPAKARRLSVDPTALASTYQMSTSPQKARGSFMKPAAPKYGLIPPSETGEVQVQCMARTRIPTPHGEFFLHLYHNSLDTKEHLALVYDQVQLDPHIIEEDGNFDDEVKQILKRRRPIRSRTLDAIWRDGETTEERLLRGAFIGRLTPSHGIPSRPDSRSENKFGVENAIAEDHEAEGEDPRDVVPIVRLHSECFTGETLGSMKCDCGEQWDRALEMGAAPQRIQLQHSHAHLQRRSSEERSESGSPTPGTPDVIEEMTMSMSIDDLSDVGALARSAPLRNTTSSAVVPGRAALIYLRQEGRGIGLLEKLKAYNLQEQGMDTLTANLMLGHGADERKYDVAVAILRDLGLHRIRLLTNNPDKVASLKREGIEVAERVGMQPRMWSTEAHQGELDAAAYEEHRLRQSGVGLIGQAVTKGPDLERYLRTKAERMGHLIDLPENGKTTS